MTSYSPLKKNTAQRIVFPILDNTGALVSGAAGLDSNYSVDGGNFGACSDEAHEIATSSGMYYLDLTTGETNGDCIALIIKTSTTNAKTTPLVFYTQSTTLDAVQTEVNKIGTITNTGGTATLGAVLGDVANTAVATRLGTIAGYIDTEVGAIKTVTDKLGFDGGNNVNAVVKAQDNIDFGALQKTSLNAATPAVTVSDKTGFALSAASIDAIYDEALAGHTTSDSAGLAIKNLLKIGKNKWAIVGTTLTFYDDNGSSILYQFTLDDGAAPTSRTPA
jgi:hypothetical protein